MFVYHFFSFGNLNILYLTLEIFILFVFDDLAAFLKLSFSS